MHQTTANTAAKLAIDICRDYSIPYGATSLHYDTHKPPKIWFIPYKSITISLRLFR